MTLQNDILRRDAIEWLIESLGTDEPDILLDVVQTFRGDSAAIIARMKKALEENDEQTLFRSAHTLKSSSSIIGAELLADICEKMELSLRRKLPIDLPGIVKEISDAFLQVDKLLIIEVAKLENQMN